MKFVENNLNRDLKKIKNCMLTFNLGNYFLLTKQLKQQQKVSRIPQCKRPKGKIDEKDF